MTTTTTQKKQQPARKKRMFPFVKEKFASHIHALTVVKNRTQAGYRKVLLKTKKDITVYKRVFVMSSHGKRTIELIIPKNTLFWAHERSNKCRAYRAISKGSGRSLHDWSFIYRTDETVVPLNSADKRVSLKKFTEDAGICASGIHFFVNKMDADLYA